jgi:hypothetical protein
MLTLGGLTVAQAQGQTCRDVGNLTICADNLIAEVGAQFHLRGNLRIGPKGGAAVVHVTDLPSTFNGSALTEGTYTAQYFHLDAPDPNTGTTDFIIGEAKFINDPTGLHMMGAQVIDDPSNTDPNAVVVGRLFVDPVNRRIFLPAAGAVPVFDQKGVKRNQAYRLAFISHAGALSFYKGGGTVDELGLVDAEFDLNNKIFKAIVPVDLKLGDQAENPNLRVTLRFQWTETRQFSGSVDGFKASLGGLLVDVSGVVFKPPTGNSSAEFEAATAKVLKSDNPNVPNLDPTDATLIFAFSKLKYKDGAWSIGGVETPVKDWEFGNAFKMVNQTLGFVTEAGVQFIQIKSTMRFGSGTDASNVPIVLKIGRGQDNNGQFKPVFSAGLQNISPKLGAMKFNLTGAAFVGDGAQNFWGIQATSAALQWPPHLGGKTAAAVNNFKLGINNERKFQFGLGNGTVGLPEFENSIFKGALQATLGVVSDTLTITGTGTFAIKLAGNQNSAGVVTTAILRYNKNVDTASTAAVTAAGPFAIPCNSPIGKPVNCPGPSQPPPPAPGLKAFELKLTGFNIKIAGFGLTVNNPKSLDDGGFTADDVGFTLPSGLASQASTGAKIQGLVVKGNGDVSIQGGGFELAPLNIGNLQLVAIRGSFVKTPEGNYEFKGGGKLPLPGIEPGAASGGISVDVTIRTTGTGAFAGMGAKIEIFSPPLPPIPLGASGLVLTSVSGSFDINNGTLTIGLGATAVSQYSLPLPQPIGPLPLVKAVGNVTFQFNPFKMSGNAALSVLIFEVANASVNIGAGAGFNGGQGMNASVNVNAVVVKGAFAIRVGKGTPSDPNKRRFAASAHWELGIDANQFGAGLPPFNLRGVETTFSGGVFNDTNLNPPKETVGIKGTRCGVVLCIGIFINLQKSIGSGGFFDFTNLDKYVLIPAAATRVAAANNEAGFASRVLSVEEAQAAGWSLAAAQVEGVQEILQDTIPIQLDQKTTLVAGVNFTEGNPTIRLKLPDNSELSEATVDNVNSEFIRETTAVSGTNLLIALKNAEPGQYQLIVDNAPADYDELSYTVNQAPVVNITSAACVGRIIFGVTITCAGQANAAENNAPDAADATGVMVSWNASDIDSPNATVSVGYVVDTGDPNTVDFASVTILKEGLPLGAGSYTENLKEIGSGKYRMVIIVDDGQNSPVYIATNLVVTVDDKLAPSVPTGLTATPQAGELLIKWTQNGERDLAGYEIGFGLVNDPNQFIYSRNMGPKDVVTGTNNIVDAKLWGLDDNTTVFYGLRAYDTSGNFSAWTPLQSAQPWALSPNVWTPTPNGVGNTNVEIGFAVPMKGETLENALTVKDAGGNALPGSYYLLTDAEQDSIVGVGFTPNVSYKGAASAVLKGGSGGVMAEDGRTMGGDYSWSFTLKPNETFLPIITK